MAEFPTLTIEIEKGEGAGYAVRLAFEQPGSAAPRSPEKGKAAFDWVALREAQFYIDAQKYGQLLSKALLGEKKLLEYFNESLAIAQSQGQPYRIRLRIHQEARELHELRWETLVHPDKGSFVTQDGNLGWSRELYSEDWSTISLRPRGQLRILIAIANPGVLAKQGGLAEHSQPLAPVDVVGESERARAALEEVGEIHELASPEGGPWQVSLENLRGKLQEGFDIVYLICHGALLTDNLDDPQSQRTAFLVLEKENGDTAFVPGKELAGEIEKLPAERRPRLMVLAACQGAGRAVGFDPERDGSTDEGELAAVGPLLATAGVPAVVAMQGNVSMRSVALFMEVFFRELNRSAAGDLELAMALGRAAIRERLDWWAPVLFSRLREGRLFAEEVKAGEKRGSILETLLRAQYFKDREQELANLLADLKVRGIAEVCGPGGMGKTALAAEALAVLTKDGTQAPQDYPDGVVVYSFYRRGDMNAAYEHILRCYDREAKPTPADAVKELLGWKRALLMLDGAEEAQNLEELLAMRGRCGVIITSREQGQGAAEWQDLEPLKEEDGLKLLQDWGGKWAADEAAGKKICELVGELPMAIVLTGSTMKAENILAKEFAKWLEQSPLEAMDQGERRRESVSVLVGRDLEKISPEARQALGVVGLLAGAQAPFEREWIKEALGWSEGTVLKSFGELGRYSLVRRSNEGWYQVSHALVHTYVRDQLSGDQGVVGQALVGLCKVFDELVEEELPKGKEGYLKLNQICPHGLAITERMAEAGKWAEAKVLAWGLQAYLDLQGYPILEMRLAENGVRGAQKVGERNEEGRWLGILGLAYWSLGQVEKSISYFQQALEIAEETGDRKSEGDQLSRLGLAYADFENAEKSLEYLEKSLDIAREIGDRQGETDRLGNLGLLHTILYQGEKATFYYEQSLAIAREIMDRRQVGKRLGNLGLTYANLGQKGKAIENYELALEILRQIGDKRNEGIQNNNLGLAYYDLKQAEKAIEYFQKALEITKEIGDRRTEGQVLSNLGNAYAELSQVKKAIGYYEQALAIAREIGDRRGEGNRLLNLGFAYSDLGILDKACLAWRQALNIYEEIKDPVSTQVRKILKMYCEDS